MSASLEATVLPKATCPGTCSTDDRRRGPALRVSIPTLRFYEESGLLTSTRDSRGRRTYAGQTLRRLTFVAAGRRLGLSLAAIRTALSALPADRAPTVRQWSAIGADRLDRIDAEISDLTALRSRLADCVTCGLPGDRRL